MSATDPKIDLGTLVRERGAAPVQRPRRWLRLVLPLALVVAFVALFATNLRDLVLGARAVSVVRPTPVGTSSGHASGTTIATQAAGWIEPDPFPVHVAALADGVVREMLVQESDAIEKDAPIAYLIDDGAKIALDLADGRLATGQGEVASAFVELTAARDALEAAIELTAAREGAAAEVEARRAEAELKQQAVAKGRAQLTLATEELAVQQELERAGAAGPRQVEIAAARVEEARGELAGLEADAALAKSTVKVAEVELERARRDDELRIEERRRVAAAEAGVAIAQGRLKELEAARDEARLQLERMVVRAPSAGIVLERLAVTGTPLVGMEHTVATLYDPRSIRARVDVPQQDLGKLSIGQTAQIESDARPGQPYSGEVLRIVRRADIQKVTMQAHVRVVDADELLRPEMLVQVRFMSKAETGAGEAAAAVQRAVAIPARLVDGERVWVLDAEHGTASARQVELGGRNGELVIVNSGLDLSDKLLVPLDGRPLREGERVRTQEERQ